MSNSVRPHRWQPTRLPRPWDSPGKNTGVGCHFLLQCMKVKSESEVTQSCPTLSNPMDCSLPGSSVHGIFQSRVLEWGAIAFSGQRMRWLSGITDPMDMILSKLQSWGRTGETGVLKSRRSQRIRHLVTEQQQQHKLPSWCPYLPSYPFGAVFCFEKNIFP